MSSRFDEMFDQAAPLVLRQAHQRDKRPVDGGQRWPVSAVLLPDAATTNRLDQLTREVTDLAGVSHFHTGAKGSAHFTVRALEKRRDVVTPDDVLVRRYEAAMGAAAGRCRPVSLHITGLTLTAGSVMACASPVDSAADDFMDAFTEELGPDAWFEDFRRDIWYSTVVHFAADIDSPGELIEWVGTRRDTDFGIARMNLASLVRFRYCAPGDRPRMRPELLASAVLSGSA
jgi:hypothetical protein